jgi:hypothetical protein
MIEALQQFVTFFREAGLLGMMAFFWFLEFRQRLKLQNERDALLERVLVVTKSCSDAVNTLTQLLRPTGGRG